MKKCVVDCWMDGWMTDGSIAGLKEGWMMERWVDGWMDKGMDVGL